MGALTVARARYTNKEKELKAGVKQINKLLTALSKRSDGLFAVKHQIMESCTHGHVDIRTNICRICDCYVSDPLIT